MNSEHRALCDEILSSIAHEDLRATFTAIIKQSNSLKEYTCYPQPWGKTYVFRYKRTLDGKIPYDFLINKKKGLLFYFRDKLSSKSAHVKKVTDQFTERYPRANGAVWVRINNANDASKILGLVFEKPSNKVARTSGNAK